MERDERGYWTAVLDGVGAGDTYVYRLGDSLERPDPASPHQPHGIHGASRVVDHAFAWEDGDWRGIPLKDMVIYEVHTGTFTPEGTFGATIGRLDELAAFGVNALEIMPVGQFPGERGWGYEGVYPFAVQESYGGPGELKRLINECHKRGVAVLLDVVYNHLGPGGTTVPTSVPIFRTGTVGLGQRNQFDGLTATRCETISS
jgi:maltooligosyltrehalose trehalohydrolase